MTEFQKELTIDGHAILLWMKQAGLLKAKELLVGLAIDDGIDEHLWKILDIEPTWTLIAVLGVRTKRIPPGLLPKALVIETRPGAPLKEAIDGIKTDWQRSVEAAQSELSSLSFPVTKLVNASDAIEALDMMRDFHAARAPTNEQENVRYALLRNSNLHQLGAKIVRQWFEMKWKSTPKIDGSLLIKLVFFLRHSGDFDAALKAADFGLSYNNRVFISQSQRAIISTERSAILMDLFEVRRSPDLLKEARKSAGMSFAITQSEEVRAVYQRLKKLEDEI